MEKGSRRGADLGSQSIFGGPILASFARMSSPLWLSSVGIAHHRLAGESRCGLRRGGLLFVLILENGQVFGSQAEDGEAGSNHRPGDRDFRPFGDVAEA